MTSAAQLILASASPARRRLLLGAGIDSLVRPSDFDESQIEMEDPYYLVQTLAQCKASTIAKEYSQQGVTVPTLVLGCDSVLAIHGEIHGKPATPKTAIARWQRMRGHVGQLYTGHALLELRPDMGITGRSRVYCQITHVYFAHVSDRQIAEYVATGEPMQCAGCFALEGRGGLFVEKLEGCYSNVIGLSLPLFRRMLDELGYDVADFWTDP